MKAATRVPHKRMTTLAVHMYASQPGKEPMVQRMKSAMPELQRGSGFDLRRAFTIGLDEPSAAIFATFHEALAKPPVPPSRSESRNVHKSTTTENCSSSSPTSSHPVKNRRTATAFSPIASERGSLYKRTRLVLRKHFLTETARNSSDKEGRNVGPLMVSYQKRSRGLRKTLKITTARENPYAAEITAPTVWQPEKKTVRLKKRRKGKMKHRIDKVISISSALSPRAIYGADLGDCIRPLAETIDI